jgi:dienelactone hydrolase
MRSPAIFEVCLVAAALGIASCKNEEKKEPQTRKSGIKEENITYSANGVTMKGFVAYDSGTNDKRPVVLVIHEWWGQNDYPRSRARQLAELGYLAMAVDMFGDGKTVDNPTDAGKMIEPFYKDPKMAKGRFDAALARIKTYPQAGDKIATIGYCFGGGMALTMAELGDDLTGVVSFHGMLNVVPPNKELLKAKILVCHGADDKFVLPPDVATFRKQMDSVGADYAIKTYPGATHAFTNPNATAMGQKFNIPIAYNAAADSASWSDMKEFFARIFK